MKLRKNRVVGIVRGAVFVLVTAASLCVAPRTNAQMGMNFGMGGGMGAGVSSRDLETYAKILNLTPEQKEAAKVLVDGVRAQGRRLQEEMEKQGKALQEKMRDGDFTVFQKELPVMIKDMRDKRDQITKQFTDDVKALLTPEQAANWTRVERAKRRSEYLRVSFVSGSGVDLVSLVDRAKVGEKAGPELASLLEEYEVKVDDPVQALQKLQEKQTQDFIDGNLKAGDMQAAQKMFQDYAELGTRVRDVNREYFRKISGVLPEDEAAKLDLEFKRRSFPRIYRESYPQKLFAAATGMSDATDEQKKSVAELKANYQRDAASINERWAKAVEEQEAKSGGAFGAMMSGFMGGGGSEDVSQARDARKDLDRKTEDRLRSILTEPQRAKLPEEEDRPMNPGMDLIDMEGLEEDAAPGK